MHNKSNYSPQAQTWPDVQLLQKSPRLKPASLTRGAKPLRGILTAFTAGWGVAAVCPWNQSHLAWSQQHEIPLSLQLAHCKLCRQGVPNKQATRANITCSTLLFFNSRNICIIATVWSLQTLPLEILCCYHVFCHRRHLRAPWTSGLGQIIELFLTVLLECDQQTIQIQCVHKQTRGHKEGSVHEK